MSTPYTQSTQLSPGLPNLFPSRSLCDLRTSNKFTAVSDWSDVWDPHKAYDEAELEARLSDASSETVSALTNDSKSTLLPQSRSTTLHLGSGLTCASPRSSLSNRGNCPTIHRHLVTTSSPSPCSNTQTSTSVSFPLLPPIKTQPTLTISLADSPRFSLSLSNLGSPSDSDSRSCSSDQEDLKANDLAIKEDLVSRTKTLIKRSFSNADIYGMSCRGTSFDSPPVYVTSVTPPATSSIFPPPWPREGMYSSSPLQSPVDSAVHFSNYPASSTVCSTSAHSLYSSPSFQSFSSKPGIRPLPKTPVNVSSRFKPSNWVPPASWKGPDESGSQVPENSSPISRPKSALHIVSETRARPDQIPLRPNRPTPRRPQTAPDGGFRPPANFDRSPLILLDNSRSQSKNFLKFDRTALPTQSDLELASKLEVIGESGARVPFGTLFRDQKTVVIFIRHFWCPMCQDYMYSLNKTVNPELLDKSGVQLVIVGNGSHSMIKAYCKIFKSPFKMYTDPSLHVYNALGMSLRTSDAGPQSECGEYVKHGRFRGAVMTVKNALTNGLPVWGKSGDIQQLGGEFVLGPELSCTFAHRMHTTRSHTPVSSVLHAAGVPVRAKVYMHRQLMASVSTVGTRESRTAKRANLLMSLRKKKEERRYGSQWSIE